jgi:hypothetical protein
MMKKSRDPELHYRHDRRYRRPRDNYKQGSRPTLECTLVDVPNAGLQISITGASRFGFLRVTPHVRVFRGQCAATPSPCLSQSFRRSIICLACIPALSRRTSTRLQGPDCSAPDVVSVCSSSAGRAVDSLPICFRLVEVPSDRYLSVCILQHRISSYPP